MIGGLLRELPPQVLALKQLKVGCAGLPIESASLLGCFWQCTGGRSRQTTLALLLLPLQILHLDEAEIAALPAQFGSSLPRLMHLGCAGASAAGAGQCGAGGTCPGMGIASCPRRPPTTRVSPRRLPQD